MARKASAPTACAPPRCGPQLVCVYLGVATGVVCVMACGSLPPNWRLNDADAAAWRAEREARARRVGHTSEPTDALQFAEPQACVSVDAPTGAGVGVGTAAGAEVRVRVTGPTYHAEAVRYGREALEVVAYGPSHGVWQYDVPPTPYGTGAELHRWFVCGCQLRESLELCERDLRDRPHPPSSPEPCDEAEALSHETVTRLPLRNGYYRLTAAVWDVEERTRIWYVPHATTHVRVGPPATDALRLATVAQQRAAKAERRAAYDAAAAAKAANIAKEYVPLHPQIYEFSDKWLAPELAEALALEDDEQRRGELWHLTTEQNGPHSGLRSLRVLSDEFCRLLIAELQHISTHYSHLNTRPNSMNSYGAVLDDFGFRPFFDAFQQRVVVPLAHVLLPEWSAEGLDHHHAFAVKYKIGEDEALDYHMDESEVTLNVCLGTAQSDGTPAFSGGNVYFRGRRGTPSEQSERFEFAHIPGVGLLHAGQHWHGARRIQSGERYNLILWSRSTRYHQSAMEQFLDRCPSQQPTPAPAAMQQPTSAHSDL